MRPVPSLAVSETGASAAVPAKAESERDSEHNKSVRMVILDVGEATEVP